MTNRTKYIDALVYQFQKGYHFNPKFLAKILWELFSKQDLTLVYAIEMLQINGIFNKKKEMSKDIRANKETLVQSITGKHSINDAKLLDIGAGDGATTLTITGLLGIKPENTMINDPKAVPSPNYTIVDIDSLEPASIDIVVLFNLLHHLDPDKRTEMLTKVAKVIKPSGYVLLREHDSDNTHDYTVYVNLYHVFWYVYNNESVDEAWLFSKGALVALMDCTGFSLVSDTSSNNYQRLYVAKYVPKAQLD